MTRRARSRMPSAGASSVVVPVNARRTRSRTARTSCARSRWYASSRASKVDASSSYTCFAEPIGSSSVLELTWRLIGAEAAMRSVDLDGLSSAPPMRTPVPAAAMTIPAAIDFVMQRQGRPASSDRRNDFRKNS